ncbi:hypothetical protein, partial [Achromobacter xylosoxidans]
MTQQDDITQRVLTDDEILTATLYGQSEARMIRNGRAIESALLSKLRAPVAEQAALFAQSTTKDDKAALGMLECGKPLCAPGEHHPLCRNGWAEKKGASAPTPKPWPVEEQPDGTVAPVDPVDLACAPVTDERDALMRAIVKAGQDAGIIRADLETVSGPEFLHILECLSKASAPVADEPVPYPKREDVTPEMRASFERLFSEARKHNHGTLARNEQGAYRDLRVDADWVFYQRAWADALASAPATDLRPHLEWALRRIRTSLDTGDKYEAAQAALDAAVAAPRESAPVADERFKPPFDNCSFRMCDLPGQCRGEGKCHHPASAPVAGEALTAEAVERQYRDGVHIGSGLPRATCPCGFCVKHRHGFERGDDPAAPQASAEDAQAPADVAQLVAFILDRFGRT